MNKHELFQQLLEQINLHHEPEYLPYFEGGEIEKVLVYKKQKTWTFLFHFNDILPFEVFQALNLHLKTAFKNIATIDIRIKCKEAVLTDEKILDYWQTVVERSNISSPVVQDILRKHSPTVTNGKVLLSMDNEITQNHLKDNYLSVIQQNFLVLGFPDFQIQLNVNQEASEERRVKYLERKQEQEDIMVRQAEENIKQLEQQNKQSHSGASSGILQLGNKIPESEDIRQMITIKEEERSVVVQGNVFDFEVRELRSGRKILTFKITDYSSSFSVKMFSSNEKDEANFEKIQKGKWVRVRGSVQEDMYMRDLVITARDINEVKVPVRKDTAPEGEKRVELHLHTKMSQMDATNHISDYVAQAAKWGHKAIAVTDHAVAQAYPDAHAAGQKHGVKILYGVEANIVDDGVPVAYNVTDAELAESTYVVFDVETTGLSAVYDSIIELAAVKMYKGNVIDTFEAFINPGKPLSQLIIQLTGITDQMLKDAPSEDKIVPSFKEFCGDSILVAHNASFDMGFLNKSYERNGIEDAPNPVIDTLELSRFLHPQLRSHRLNTLAKKYNVNLEQHHRAVFDAETTGHLCWIFLKEAAEDHQIFYHHELNKEVGKGDSYKLARPFHVTILAKNQDGLKDLFKLISASNINYFYRTPRIPRSLLKENRENLLIGSSCSQGEIFESMMQRGREDAKAKAQFYDYLEVMPKPVYRSLIKREMVKNEKDLEEIISQIVKIGDELDKPVVATGNVHYLNEEDSIYREILLGSIKMNQGKELFLPKVHFRTTNEMLDEFEFLGKDKAKEIVVQNPEKIADSIEEILPIKDKLYTPNMDGSNEEITNLSYNEAKRLYGEDLPEIVEKRLQKELKSIIGNGFSVIYLISQKLVLKSNQDGYLVGSRGSVGSSFVATMTGITEVNPLPPHYRCQNCHYSHFFTDGSIGSGYDLEEKDCPNCGNKLSRDGQDIPFETFLGFYGDKVPDIDLNFSGDYQAKAHAYTKDLFGEEYVYRAGTIGTVADKTAFGYVKGYERDRDYHYSSAEIDRLAKGCTGVKRNTGQHPGGIIVIPDYMDVYDFTPIQFPADAQDSEWKTTHFDFHSIHDNVLKLDILGHDDPTVIRMLQDLSGMDPQDIPPNDPDVMKLFSGTDVLGVTPKQIFSNTGTLGIPEFGTKFVRGMLEQTKPNTFAELLQISGLSHGTDVYLGNAEVLIRDNNIPLAEVIGCRDDIMVYLIHAGMEDGLAFKIMESVRKGKGIPDEWQAEMRASKVPEWYIQSCLKIKYMFPKAHAAAYVLMALRVAYFKVHDPLLYYSAYFSIRANDFDLAAMAQGKEMIKARMKEIMDKGMDASVKEKNLLTVLELSNEMVERGFEFKMVDLDKSDASKFIIEGNSLIAPFRAISGLGVNVASQIIQAREEKPFLSKEDLAIRGKVSKTIIEYMTEHDVLKDLPDENQLSLFDF
ncbi:PolC-type DNA polymerase III [Jeotgalibaca sp. MA1X17-3]|uniref:PolC-type DNA polymerase III n=1 Tax=Jeotgalibaca sp. MA1X17-3 TaxID=2908211 RepID=UPI001F234EF0|nr:PolC-type DNA polymerase III [Jeotgalibaca sp. MA1X17-3]UJF14739.1 PolC-type DNA polymerase III [Jeotgalibaca sp. MA1X17-3]